MEITVLITESQYNRMLDTLRAESIELDGDQKEYPGNADVRTTQQTTGKDGNAEIEAGPTTDDIAKNMVPQPFDFMRGRNFRGTVK